MYRMQQFLMIGVVWEVNFTWTICTKKMRKKMKCGAYSFRRSKDGGLDNRSFRWACIHTTCEIVNQLTLKNTTIEQTIFRRAGCTWQSTSQLAWVTITDLILFVESWPLLFKDFVAKSRNKIHCVGSIRSIQSTGVALLHHLGRLIITMRIFA